MNIDSAEDLNNLSIDEKRAVGTRVNNIAAEIIRLCTRVMAEGDNQAFLAASFGIAFKTMEKVDPVGIKLIKDFINKE